MDGFSDADFDALWRYFEQTCGVCPWVWDYVLRVLGLGGRVVSGSRNRQPRAAKEPEEFV